MEISIRWNVCRICLCEENCGEGSSIDTGNSNESGIVQMRSIFSDAQLIEQIYECSGVKVEVNDNFPDKICEGCLKILKYAVKFRSSCRKSNEYLQSIVDKTKSASAMFKNERGIAMDITDDEDDDDGDDKDDHDHGDHSHGDDLVSIDNRDDGEESLDCDQSSREPCFIEDTADDENKTLISRQGNEVEVEEHLPPGPLDNEDENYIDIIAEDQEAAEEYNALEEIDCDNPMSCNSDASATTLQNDDQCIEFVDTYSCPSPPRPEVDSVFQDRESYEPPPHELNDGKETQLVAKTSKGISKRDFEKAQFEQAQFAINLIKLKLDRFSVNKRKSKFNINSQNDCVEDDDDDEDDENGKTLIVTGTRRGDMDDASEPAERRVFKNIVKKFQPKNVKRKKPADEKVHICDICGNRFPNRSLMNHHMRIHRNEKRFECELCTKRFNTSCNLQAHMRTHTGEKPFPCKYCNRRFSDRSTNIKHERLHTNEKPFICKICDKSFTLSTTLKTHEKVHTGEKPYKCENCNKAFKLPHQLKAHYNTQTHKTLVQEIILERNTKAL